VVFPEIWLVLDGFAIILARFGWFCYNNLDGFGWFRYYLVCFGSFYLGGYAIILVVSLIFGWF